MEVYSFESGLIDSRMYIVMEQKHALVIDPCVHTGVFAMLDECKPLEIQIILTHEHYDHISGVNAFRERYDCGVLCSEKCAENIQDTMKNTSRYFAIAMMNQKESPEPVRRKYDYVCQATETFVHERQMVWAGHNCYLRETPGHSPGSICILLDGHILFSGDTLIKNQEVITRLPGGDAAAYQAETRPFLMELPRECRVYPGHGEAGCLREFLI